MKRWQTIDSMMIIQIDEQRKTILSFFRTIYGIIIIIDWSIVPIQRKLCYIFESVVLYAFKAIITITVGQMFESMFEQAYVWWNGSTWSDNNNLRWRRRISKNICIKRKIKTIKYNGHKLYISSLTAIKSVMAT